MKADYCEGKVHIIEEGDTLYHLSRRFNVPLALILRANPFTDVYNLQVGDEICIPIELGRPPEQPNCLNCQGNSGRAERPNQLDTDRMTDQPNSAENNISLNQPNQRNNDVRLEQTNQPNNENLEQPNRTNNNAETEQLDQAENNTRLGQSNQTENNTRMNQPNQTGNNMRMNQPNQTRNDMRMDQPNQTGNNMRMSQPNQTESNMRMSQPNQAGNNMSMGQSSNNERPMPPIMPSFPIMPEMPNMNGSGADSNRPITLPSFPNLFSYIVEEGESLGDILDNFDVNLEDLLNFNDLDELQLLPGSVVKVPIRRENGRN